MLLLKVSIFREVEGDSKIDEQHFHVKQSHKNLTLTSLLKLIRIK